VYPYLGAIVIYTFPNIDPHDRHSEPGAGLPPCPGIVVDLPGLPGGTRVTLRLMSVFTMEVKYGAPYDPAGKPSTWRWPTEHAAG